MKKTFMLFLFLLAIGHLRGQETGNCRGADSIRIYFRQGEATVDPAFRGNGKRLTCKVWGAKQKV